MPVDLAVLRTELTTDPETLGYDVLKDRGAAARLNQAGTSSRTSRTASRAEVLFGETVRVSESDVQKARHR